MEDNYFIRYTIRYYNEDENLMEILRGIVYAKSFSEACANLEKYYGDGLDEILWLKYIRDFVLPLSEKTLDIIDDEVNDGEAD